MVRLSSNTKIAARGSGVAAAARDGSRAQTEGGVNLAAVVGHNGRGWPTGLSVVKGSTESCLSCAKYSISRPPGRERIETLVGEAGPELFVPHLPSSGAGAD
jgi:hypothetical protein